MVETWHPGSTLTQTFVRRTVVQASQLEQCLLVIEIKLYESTATPRLNKWRTCGKSSVYYI